MSNVVAIIGEYNPFHNGHAYHIQKTKQLTNADYVIAIISGNFVQRGNVSLIDKWSKADMALLNGVDLVIELPTIYSISSAENFANGAIKILNSLKIVDTLSFGSEFCDLDVLEEIAEVLTNEPSEFKTILEHELSKGLSFPKARENALLMYLNDIRKYANVLSSPNNVLGIEYLKALINLKSNLKAITIKRANTSYNSTNIINGFASSTAIRKIINNPSSLSKVVPEETFSIISDKIKHGQIIKGLVSFEKEILYKLRTSPIDYIANLPDVSEGLEFSIKNAANSCNNIMDLISLVKSKRYTQTRIQRILLYALLDITKQDMEYSRKGVPYIRILGMTENGKHLLSEIASNKKLNIITSPKKFMDNCNNKIVKNLFSKDILASNIYTLGYEYESLSNLDFSTPLITV